MKIKDMFDQKKTVISLEIFRQAGFTGGDHIRYPDAISDLKPDLSVLHMEQEASLKIEQ